MGKRKFVKKTFSAGSALILAVVLTSLLAIVGTIFLMTARVDKIATSAISENKELNFAVEAVVARLSRELALDVPGPQGAEYYDYPGDKDKWLASLEPYKDGDDYRWRQISDVTGFLEDNYFDVEDVSIEPPYPGKYINDYPVITLDSSGELEERWADADGDGIADSKWVELDGMTSAKGKRIYAAIRVIDNGGMINVNTAYEFDPNGAPTSDRIDGSSLTQINLKAVAEGSDTIAELHDERAGDSNSTLTEYERDCIWRIEYPDIDYLPFDISDELELRNRYFLTSLAKTRLEDTWNSTIGHSNFKRVPYDGEGIYTDDHWWRAINQDANQPDKRHFLTTYNMDRIIDPNGVKMLNINDANARDIYETVRDALADPNFTEVVAQTAVNLIDFRDGDSNVTVFDPPPTGGKRYYGFESPCIYISELVHKFTQPNVPPGLPRPASLINRSYAIELHKPYSEDDYPDADNQWELVIEGYGTFPVMWSGSKSFHVMLFEHSGAPLSPQVNFDMADEDPNFSPSAEITESVRPGTVVFGPGRTVSLQRLTNAGSVTVDSVTVKFGPGPPYLLWEVDGLAHSYQRDVTPHKNIRRLWDDSFSFENSETLGDRNLYTDDTSLPIQAHPADKKFTNVGEIGMLFREDVYGRTWNSTDTDDDVRLDLAEPNFRQIFQYLTRFDPTRDSIDNDGDGDGEGPEVDGDELKIPGRININTAPAYVMAQLPWMQYGDTDFERATAICDYRDETADGFDSIGELMQVIEMHYYANDGSDLDGFPDLTTPDHYLGVVADDFEERDVIFARISDLITVRSDVFTAYILVRIGIDGPQKRVIAVLDRSNVYSSGGKVRVAALHPVPDPR